ncbi:MAG TPA: FAD:protein FMN transferase [Actinomycetota bacterium]
MTPTVRHDFRAMGTPVALIADRRAGTRAFARAARAVGSVFAREELRFSRFRADSELSRVNARAGRWTKVSPSFAALLGYSLEAAARSAGLFDPTVLPALVAAGYDRDFDELLAGARDALHPPRPCGRWTHIELDGELLRLPRDVGLDFGGVAKGWTVDLAARAAVEEGLPWAVVNAGGDLRIAGTPPADGISVSVEDPDDRSAEVARLSLESGALATSSVTARAWGPGLHHLIDPRTGLPADTGVVQATVWAPTCAEAEVRSTWALLEGPAVLDRTSAVLVMDDGRVVMNLEGRSPAEVAS